MKVYHYTQDNVKAYRGFTDAEKSPLEENMDEQERARDQKEFTT